MWPGTKLCMITKLKKMKKWDRTQQVDRIIFGENMKLLLEALEGEYLLSLTSESFVMLRVCN